MYKEVGILFSIFLQVLRENGCTHVAKMLEDDFAIETSKFTLQHSFYRSMFLTYFSGIITKFYSQELSAVTAAIFSLVPSMLHGDVMVHSERCWMAPPLGGSSSMFLLLRINSMQSLSYDVIV